MESSHRAEYGRAEIDIRTVSRLYGEESLGQQQVWMSHGDHAETLPRGFTVAAESQGVSLSGCSASAFQAFNICKQLSLPEKPEQASDEFGFRQRSF